MIVKDKLIISAGGTSTALGGSNSIVKSDSFVSAFLDSSVTDIITGNFVMYGSDLLTLASFGATLFMIGWRVYFDRKKNGNLVEQRG